MVGGREEEEVVYFPGPQMEQTDEAMTEYWPAVHGRHTVADADENVPDAHIPLTAVSPVVPQYVPAGQELQLDDPAEDWK